MEEKMRRLLASQAVRYVIVGAMTTLVDYVIYLAFLTLSAGYLLSNTLGWTGAVIFAFFANRKVVFRSGGKRSEEFFKFVLTRLSTLAVENILLFLLIGCIGMGDIVAKIAVSVVTVVLNYCVCKYGIFKEVT